MSTAVPAASAAPEQTSFSDAFDAAVATPEADSTSKETPVTTTEHTPEPPKGVETAPAEADAEPDSNVIEEASDAALNLGPEELAAIKANPATAKLYKSLMRASTAKFQEISANKRFLDSIRENPRAVIESAARNMGLQLVEHKDTQTEQGQGEVVDEVMDEMVQLFGPELAPAVRPVMERMVRQLVDKEVNPIRQSQEAYKAEQMDRQSKAHAATFRAKHPDISPEIESKMMEIGRSVSPNEGISPVAYLDLLHTLATAGDTASKTAKLAAERIRAAQESAEPRRGSAPATTGGGGVKDDMTISDAFDAAWAEIKSERKS
jgi:hypothetical protein